MATTTNFGWTTPDDTALVKDGASAIRTLGSSIDTSMAQLKGGTTGQILSKTSNGDMAFTWINNDQGDITAVTAGTGISGGGTSGAVTITNSMATEITASGDIIIGTGSGTFDNLPIGTTGQVLTADTTVSPYKVKWAAVATGDFVGCSLYKVSTGQVVGGGASAAVSFDGENFDSNGFHDNSTNNTRVTIPSGQAGKYLVSGRTIWNEYNKGKVGSLIRKNGSTTLAYSVDYTATDYWESHQITALVDLAVGDYIELVVENGGGGNRTIHADNNATQGTQLLVAKV